MKENLVYMRKEDNMVTFERENLDTIDYDAALVPGKYKENDIIVCEVTSFEGDYFIKFIERNDDEMKKRKKENGSFIARLRCRMK